MVILNPTDVPELGHALRLQKQSEIEAERQRIREHQRLIEQARLDKQQSELEREWQASRSLGGRCIIAACPCSIVYTSHTEPLPI